MTDVDPAVDMSRDLELPPLLLIAAAAAAARFTRSKSHGGLLVVAMGRVVSCFCPPHRLGAAHRQRWTGTIEHVGLLVVPKDRVVNSFCPPLHLVAAHRQRRSGMIEVVWELSAMAVLQDVLQDASWKRDLEEENE